LASQGGFGARLGTHEFHQGAPVYISKEATAETVALYLTEENILILIAFHTLNIQHFK
jgi:hypothetical protein